MRQTNADFTLGELRAVIFVRLIKYDLGFDALRAGSAIARQAQLAWRKRDGHFLMNA